ncbi:MAG: DUF502 domain-containing protein [Chitinophagaceae bacterium]|nr:DUF502 domain-containing protein [Chitinophagaceae bacterium]MCB9045056.1 DUF502 domain-containing protein [Chitinophagales bacterium]
MRRITGLIVRSFLQGILILSPIAVTAYIIYAVFDSIDTLIPSLPRGLGFLLVIGVVTTIGYLGTRLFIGRMVIDGFDYLLQNTPGIKFIYSSIKDVMDSFMGDKKRFNTPVWVCTNLHPEMWRIGFMTQKDLAFVGMAGKVSVYLPHSYAISGWVIVVDANNIKPVTKMNSAEAMKFAVSGGITSSVEEHKHDLFGKSH